MLHNNTFLKTRIQRLLDGLIFVEKGSGVHVQRMLKMSRGLYCTGGKFKKNKTKENLGPYDHDLANSRFDASLFFLNASYTFEGRFAGGSIVDRLCMLPGRRV